MAMIGDEWSKAQTPHATEAREFLKELGKKVNDLAQSRAIPGRSVRLLHATYLLAGIDNEKLVAIFCDVAGQDNLQYRDFRIIGVVQSGEVVALVQREVGDVIAVFEADFAELADQKRIAILATEYVDGLLRKQKHIEGVRPHRYFSGSGFSVDEKLAFVIMPFGDSVLDSIYRECIKASAEDLGLRCERADDILRSSEIMQDVWQRINEARVVIALPKNNPNVCYELGIAHALQRPVIILHESGDGRAFDVAGKRTINYSRSPDGFEELKSEMGRFIHAELTEESAVDDSR